MCAVVEPVPVLAGLISAYDGFRLKNYGQPRETRSGDGGEGEFLRLAPAPVAQARPGYSDRSEVLGQAS